VRGAARPAVQPAAEQRAGGDAEQENGDEQRKDRAEAAEQQVEVAQPVVLHRNSRIVI
jgi:hypothetical protein